MESPQMATTSLGCRTESAQSADGAKRVARSARRKVCMGGLGLILDLERVADRDDEGRGGGGAAFILGDDGGGELIEQRILAGHHCLVVGHVMEEILNVGG